MKYKRPQNNYNTLLEPILRKELIFRITLAIGPPWFFTSASFGTTLMVRRSSTKVSPFSSKLVSSLSWTTYANNFSTPVHQPSMTMDISSLSSPELVPTLPVCYPSLCQCILTLSNIMIPSSLMLIFIVLSKVNLSIFCLHKWWMLRNQQQWNISQIGVWMMSYRFRWARKRRWIRGGILNHSPRI